MNQDVVEFMIRCFIFKMWDVKVGEGSILLNIVVMFDVTFIQQFNTFWFLKNGVFDPRDKL